MSVTLAAAGVVAADDGRTPGLDPRWEAIHEAARIRLAGTPLTRAVEHDDVAARLPRLDETDLPRPAVIVVGFTGGLERHDSAISGVVRLRRAVNARLGDSPEVAMLTYNNWNLVQPLFYRHHHRISHDVRLQHYLLDIVVVHLELLAGEQASSERAGNAASPGPPGA